MKSASLETFESEDFPQTSNSPEVFYFDRASRAFRVILAPLSAVLAFKVMLFGFLLLRLGGGGELLYAPSIFAFGMRQLYVSLINMGFISKVFRPAPALIISGEGIEDLGGPAAAGFLPWSCVVSARPEHIFLHKGVAIQVDNPDELLSRSTGLRWCLQAWNHQMFGTPVHIPIEGAGITTDDLIDKVFARIAHKKAQPVVDGPMRQGAPYSPRTEYTSPYVENPRAGRPKT